MLKKTTEDLGTSLQGYIEATRAEITAVLGEPMEYDEGDKVTVEWAVQLGSTVATVYDWKRYDLGTPAMNELMTYNIGGNNAKAVTLVTSMVELGRKLAEKEEGK